MYLTLQFQIYLWNIEKKSPQYISPTTITLIMCNSFVNAWVLFAQVCESKVEARFHVCFTFIKNYVYDSVLSY